MYHNAFAVSVTRGVSLLSFIGPGVSARYSCMPPTPSIGRIATAGFEDVIEIGRQKRSRMYDLMMDPETPVFLAPGRRRAGIAERIDADGSIRLPLDEASVIRAVKRLVENEAIEAIAHGDSSTSRVVGRRIGELSLPPGATIGALVRGDDVLMAHDDVVIESEDHVILFLIDKSQINDVERLFQVAITFV